MLIFCLFKRFVPWLRRSGLLTFFSSLVIQESLINCAIERLRSRIFSHCENILSFCLSASHPVFSWARNRRNGVRFPKHPQNVSRSFWCSGPTFHFWARLLTTFVVELGLTGLTSTSWYVRTTRSESLAAYQSSVSVLTRILKLSSSSQKSRPLPKPYAHRF